MDALVGERIERLGRGFLRQRRRTALDDAAVRARRERGRRLLRNAALEVRHREELADLRRSEIERAADRGARAEARRLDGEVRVVRLDEHACAEDGAADGLEDLALAEAVRRDDDDVGAFDVGAIERGHATNRAALVAQRALEAEALVTLDENCTETGVARARGRNRVGDIHDGSLLTPPATRASPGSCRGVVGP